MVPLEGESTNSKHHSDRKVAGALRRPIGGLSNAKNSREIKEMVPLSRETSNSLFEVFEEWHDHLKHVDFEKIDKKYQETLNDVEDK